MAKYTRVIVDAMNLVHRAYHTTVEGLRVNDSGTSPVDAPTLKPPTGMDAYPTGVLYVSTLFYLNLLRRWLPDQVIFVWDGNGALTWRKQEYSRYKANRDAARALYTSEELYRREVFMKEELGDVRYMVDGFGGMNLTAPDGMEADDVISHLTRNLTCADNTTDVIISTDSDLIQLVRQHCVTVFSPTKQILYWQRDDGAIVATDENMHTSGVAYASPMQALLTKVLTGDRADNVPGVPNCGDVSARLLAATISDYASTFNIEADDLRLLFNGSHDKGLIFQVTNTGLRMNSTGALIRRAEKLMTGLLSNAQSRAEFRTSYYLCDLSTRPYREIERGVMREAIQRATRAYVRELKTARAVSVPVLARDNEHMVCPFSNFFGKRGFKMAFDDEAREEAGLRVRELHYRHKKYIRALAPHAQQAWKRFV